MTIAGSTPFSGVHDLDIPELKRKGEISKISKEKCPRGIEELIKLCWSLDPQKRPTASGLREILDIVISSLPKKGASIEEEFAALNHSLDSLLTSRQCKLSFFMGFHPRVGKESVLRSLPETKICDYNAFRGIFEFCS
jgi:hypothetical protein